ncbi:mitofilin family membrane protein [Thalassobaculum sp.]|uniref:mitofilin family membrane protein n=1 Tax=Thalassobaculum sp. TaxID=2022740 RepID=UPI0032EC2CDD
MADTPKGDTASPTDDAEPIRLGEGAADAETVSADTIAANAADDILMAGSRDGRAAEPSDADANPAPTRTGGGRRYLVLAILVVLAVGAGYATYPMWRAQVAPLAQRIGITLPEIGMATAPTETPPAESKPAAANETTAPAATPTVKAPEPPATTADPALAGDVDRLIDRVNALEQRLAAVESKPVEPTADTGAITALEARLDAATRKLNAVADEVTIVREGLATSGGTEGLGPLAAKLSERLQGLTGRVSALEQEPAAPAVAPERLDALQSRLDNLSGSLDGEVRKSAEDVVRLETLQASAQGRLDEMQRRVEELAKALENTRSGREKAGAFLLAANQLAATSATSADFNAELGALRAAAPGDPEVSGALDTLAPHATGVPSMAVLRERFGRTASAAVDASVVGTGEGVIGQALTRVASLVTIRRTATAESEGLDAYLVEAETALAAGDLTAAIAAVRKLDGDPAKATAGWLADAEARVTVDASVRTIQAKALAGVAGG